ncbi:hypothetical protein [Umezakia ovalisporum]|uniref:hypothetical protein n=1 Tax=Umezakia ovalisporum TaxID=75695 RepID=UPI0039C6D452
MSNTLSAELIKAAALATEVLRVHANRHKGTRHWDKWAKTLHEKMVGIQAHLRQREFITRQQAQIITTGLALNDFSIPDVLRDYVNHGATGRQAQLSDAIPHLQDSKRIVDDVLTTFFKIG